MTIRRESIDFAKRKSKHFNSEYKKLSEEMYSLEAQISENPIPDQELTEQHLRVKNEWEQMEREKTNGAIIRSKARWVEDGERNSKYFFHLEKHNQQLKNIKSIRNNETGESIVDQVEILEYIRTFYRNLYSNDNNVVNSSPHLNFPNSVQASDSDILTLENPITSDEIKEAIDDLPGGKTPGIDGLSSNFYKTFWNDLQPHFMRMANYVFENRNLSNDQKHGIITLLPKQDKDLTNIKNWRPISILNSDYKILTKIFANRLKTILPDLIHPDQTGFVLGRQIGENVRIVKDLMDHCRINEIEGILVLLDFEKAFDSVSWDFLDYVLKSFGFEEYFRSWVKIFYTDIYSSVMNNGNISSRFSLGRGIRQGCPISAYLFILCVELLAQRIRSNNLIEGLTINNVEYKLLQFADDTALILKNSESLEVVMAIINEFYLSSGLKLNINKTILVQLGGERAQVRLSDFLINMGLEWCVDPFRYLGIYFHHDELLMEYKNYRHRLENMKNLTRIWLQRDLSLKGKITIVKSLAVSQLIFPLYLLNIPKWVIDEANKIIYRFLWNEKMDKVKRTTIQRPISEGGLNMTDLDYSAKTLKIKWIFRLLDNEGAKWANIPLMYFHNLNLRSFCQTNYCETYIPSRLPWFYKQCLIALSEIKPHNILTINQVLNENLWYNKEITSKREPYLYMNWLIKGILKVGDILDANNEFLSSDALKAKYNFINDPFLDFYSLRGAIPRSWKMILKGDVLGPTCERDEIYVEINNENFLLRRCNNKLIYQELLHKTCTGIPLSARYWKRCLNIDYEDMSSFYCIPFVSVKECKVQSFQYKILNNIYNNRLRLKEWRLKPSSDCIYCNQTDTLLHHFWECNHVAIFWNSLSQWWSHICEYCTLHSSKDILLGIVDNICHKQQLNFIILYAKWFIQKSYLQEDRHDFLSFLPELKMRLIVEGKIAKKNKKIDTYNELWYNVLEAL
jgi:hypothetical protein